MTTTSTAKPACADTGGEWPSGGKKNLYVSRLQGRDVNVDWGAENFTT